MAEKLKLFIKTLILLVCMLSLFIKPIYVLCSSEVKCIEREREALLKFKQGIVVDKFSILSSWGSGEGERECCKWDGVRCSNITGHVIRLALSGYFDRGKINSTLLELKHLAYLDLSHNYLRIDNLEWLLHLSLLRYLDLRVNDLHETSNWLQQISKLSFLEELHLSECHLPSTLPAFDTFLNSSMSSLRILDVAGNNLSSFTIFDSLFNSSPRLTKIDLSSNKFNGPIPDSFGSLHFLEELWLDGNVLNEIPLSLGNLNRLHSLGLSGNAFNQPLDQIFQNLSGKASKSLEGIDLSFNKLVGSLSDITQFSSLRGLILGNNQLIGFYPQSPSQPSSLETLDLSNNKIRGSLPELRAYSSLHGLYLHGNQINGLPESSKQLPNLKYLDLSSNSLEGMITEDHLSNVPGISFIDFSDNHLSGPIPLFLFNSADLRLYKNKFFGSISHVCKAANYSNMEILDLSYNKLIGELPSCWTKTSYLQVVNLANNNLSGRIPSTFGNIPELSVLHLRNNNFVGELPHSLKNCNWLRMLDVGGNKLTGNIPQWIGTHLTNLTVLSLRFNQFHGSIDTSICHLTCIEVLDISRNNLSGKIPKCFNSFIYLLHKGSSGNTITPIYGGYDDPYVDDPYVDNVLIRWKGQDSEYKKVGLLKGIDLSNNKLVGTIPQEFFDLSGLVFLNLSRNHLTGNIMWNIGQMEMLEWLDLSRNELSGAIPNSLAQLHFLSVLDLSHNELSGKIPLGTQLQSFNDSAYAENSQLCGLPLPECPWDSNPLSSTDHGNGNDEEEDVELIGRDFYISMVFGFITGFWIAVGTLVVKHSWRQSYFNFWNKIGDCMYVTSTIYMARFKRKILN